MATIIIHLQKLLLQAIVVFLFFFFDSKPLLIVKYFCQYKHPPMAGTEDDGRSAGRSFVRSCEVGRYALDRILVDHHTTHVRTLVHTYGEI